jgi:hypothetical protein
MTTNMHTRRRPNQHLDVPFYWPGATEFSDDDVLGNAEFTLCTLTTAPALKPIVDALVRETTVAPITKKREPGSWILIYIAYILSDHSDVAKFVRKSSSHLWRECGFQPKAGRPVGRECVPDYNTVELRFRELEQDAFVEAAVLAGDELIRLARRFEPRIGQAVHIDATHYASPSRLHHCCTDEAACDAAIRASGRVPETMPRPDDDTIRKARHAEHDVDEDSEAASDTPAGVPEKTWIDPDTGWRHFIINGHEWCCEDVDASAKSYSNGTAWIGGLKMAARDAIVGGTMADRSFTAREHEWKHYPALMRRVRDVLDGEYPEIVSGDKGLAMRRIYRFNTIRGIETVFPFRKRGGKEVDRIERRCDLYDEHGVPRCKFCGGPGEQHGPGLGLTKVNGRYDRIRFRCRLGLTPDCLTTLQSVECKHDWSMLLPLSRLTERYQAMHTAQKNRESIWHADRERWNVAGIDLTGRIKRKGVGVHKLRNALARMLEWLYICLRHGWVGSHPTRNRLQPRKRSGQRGLWSTMWAREGYGTDLPYGSAAQALGLSDPDLEAEAIEEAKRRKKDGRGKVVRRRMRPRRLPRGARKRGGTTPLRT